MNVSTAVNLEGAVHRISEDRGYRKLKNQLIAVTGLAFYADRDKALAELIGSRLVELRLPDCNSYAKFLADPAKGGAEMEVLIEHLAIGETHFFRDPDQFAAIQDVIIPEILRRKQASRQIRIWSAGCASGAEPYSLAILLMQALNEKFDQWDVEIDATDLNRNNLRRASKGVFRAWALRSVSDEFKRDCFSRHGETWAIHSRYKRWVSFRYINLMANEVSAPKAHFDLILCCNVMIYFAPEASRRLIGQFHESLGANGWLVVGSSEHNSTNYQDFRVVSGAGFRLYQKLLKTDVRNGENAGRPLAHTGAGAAEKDPPMAADPPLDEEVPDLAGLRALGDRGDWNGAAAYGNRLLARNRLDPVVHFYQALIFEKLAIPAESERSLRQAIYLDRNFALAHYHLALALQRDGRVLCAARSFRNVMKVLEGMPDDQILPHGQEIRVAELRQMAAMNLERSAV